MTMSNECTELKNIRYKTMLLNGKNDIAPISEQSDLTNIENILDREMGRAQNVPWNRVDKTTRVQKLLGYADIVSIREDLSNEEKNTLRAQLIAYLDKKLLQRNKDVTYDSEDGVITDIPALEWATAPKRFTLRRCGKPTSTRPAKTRKKSDKIDSNNNKD